MNIAQVEKVRKLVKESKILNNSERQEWLALLELMNDKQVLELERILESSQPKASAQVLPPKVQPVPPVPPLPRHPTVPQLAPSGAGGSQGFGSGHILNMPKAQGVKPPPPSPNESFGKKLEAVVKEPELPAPHKDLGLSSGLKAARPEQKQPGRISLVEEVGNEKAKRVPAVKPGLEKWPEKYRLESGLAEKPQAPIVSKPAKISSLTDIQSLLVEHFSDPKSLQKVLKDYVKGYGYAQVLINLEKSALYKSYIKTGQEVLQKSVSFETLAKQGGGFMDRTKFEEFADMLRFLQSE